MLAKSLGGAHTRAMTDWSTSLPFVWILLGSLAVTLAACVWVYRRYLRFKRRCVAKRALVAERAALDLLRHEGYHVLDTQLRQTWTVRHGAQEFDINLRADVLVRRGPQRFIAEVKSSAAVADPRHGPTRRQLLEYAIAYGTDGVLLVDMHAGRVEEISFPGLWRRRWAH